ncbi:MAG TPA: tetratricopeptide repeat protein, partial [Gemmatimonadaceae bacterium]
MASIALTSPWLQRRPTTKTRRAADHLADARVHERAGRLSEAIQGYEAATTEAERGGEQATLSEALRRLAVACFYRGDRVRARELGQRSYDIAIAAEHHMLAAEALNALAGFEFDSGAIAEAREKFYRALEIGGSSLELRALVEQNLGILANIQGDLEAALTHYQRSLEASRSTGDERMCAIAYHNLGMISTDRQLWDDAAGYFDQSLAIAGHIGDVRLQGLCLLNQSEIHVARQRYDLALQSAESSLRIFDQLDARPDKADAYKVLGTVYRETGRFALAESRLRSAIELAISTGSVLSEAESSRELAKLYQLMGRNQEALALLTAAHRLFGRLDARVDLVDVAAKRANLEETYLAVVRDWGQSIESADSYTYGHCERVAGY